MPGPAARVGDTTATGDTITGPGVPTVLIGGIPASVLGNAVSGVACVGAIMVGSLTVLIMNRPAATVDSQVVGTKPPPPGVPITTAVAKGALNVIIGPSS